MPCLGQSKPSCSACANILLVSFIIEAVDQCNLHKNTYRSCNLVKFEPINNQQPLHSTPLLTKHIQILVIYVTERSRSWSGDVRLRGGFELSCCLTLSYLSILKRFPNDKQYRNYIGFDVVATGLSRGQDIE